MKNGIKKLARTLLFSAGVVLGLAHFSARATPVYQLVGHADDGGPGGWDLTLSALLDSAGASGFAHIVGGATGNIIQIIPPTNDPESFWCITVLRTDTEPFLNARTNIYIRDVGDGITSFDQFNFVSGLGIDCSFPTKDLAFLTFREGDFKAQVAATGVPESSSAIVMFAIALVTLECCRRIQQPDSNPHHNQRAFVHSPKRYRKFPL